MVKRWNQIGALALAAVIGGVGGYVAVDEFVMQRPPELAAWEASGGTEVGGEGKTAVVANGAANRGKGRIGSSGKAKVNGRPRKHGWIAEAKVGPYRQQAVRVAGVNDDGSPRVLRIGMGEVRRGFAAAVRNSARRGAKAPVNERWAKLKDYSSDGGGGMRGGEDDDLPSGVCQGDVYLSGVPMINQGDTAYCAVASAARVLQNYGIDMTMEDMADLAGSSEACGTNIGRWERALQRVANSHGLELRTVHDVTDTDQPIQSLLYNYNQTARDMGYDELYTWDYANAFVINYKKLSEDREYPVQREVMLSNGRACEAFEKNVIERIDESDPLFWTVRLGDVPEKGVASGEHSQHMRLIIGYNEERGEILYSDSWGEGHELKRMDGKDALSITHGMYYLTD